MIRKMVIGTPILLGLVIASTAYAQYSGNAWSTAYQVVNMGSSPANIQINYYDPSGVEQTAAQRSYSSVPAGSSVLVVQFSDDTSLASGRYSAVISADQPIAAVANQQLVPSGSASYSPVPPFSTYGGESQGSSTITLPAVMYNWYGYYTEMFIMNIGSATASDVDITFAPGNIGGNPTGASGVTDLNNSIPQYASSEKSQESLTALGAPSGPFVGRFLGSATITADQPIVAVVNQHNTSDYKLMTYNGFVDGATSVAVPSVMRGYYGYYTTLLIANPSSSTTANISIDYTPNTTEVYYNQAEPGSTIAPVSVNFALAPQMALTRYDGPGATDAQSDLDDPPNAYVKFYGSALVTSDIPVMVQVNVEAVATGDGQAGSYNGIPTTQATQNIVVPVVLSDFYGYYTNLVVQNTGSTGGSCSVTYTSDSTYSAVPNNSAVYNHAVPANGTFTVYEGRKGGLEIGDINSDPQWRAGGNRQFIGAATIQCDVNVVALVNEEADIAQRDSMYTFNTFNN
ncbi:MAG: hypothetical protein ACC700_12795 [Anaerolineales bacterium]